MEDKKNVVFESKKIRRIRHNEEWFFSVVDVCRALTNSADAGAYWRKLKQRLNREGSEVATFCHGLKLEASDGKHSRDIQGNLWDYAYGIQGTEEADK